MHTDRTPAVSVHPRVCGELRISKFTYDALDGSSPRVWGTQTTFRINPSWDRFIPACVGNSLGIQGSSLHAAVHPRVCGELSGYILKWIMGIGSSPRVWGTRIEVDMLGDEDRFIPACVGNSCSQVPGEND